MTPRTIVRRAAANLARRAPRGLEDAVHAASDIVLERLTLFSIDPVDEPAPRDIDDAGAEEIRLVLAELVTDHANVGSGNDENIIWALAELAAAVDRRLAQEHLGARTGRLAIEAARWLAKAAAG